MDNLRQHSIIEYSRVNREKSEETEGFDVQAGLTWIYPTNYPIRDYQYNIIEQALFKNTLVNLPTGLGKTFIAAVVMFNYYRWYPTGKIVFMAPTRPLVKQQIDACYNIMAIPKDVTVELTGTNKNSIRNEIWMDKRVFFITPQILQNDLDRCPELSLLIKCIVFDEAHRARGNYAYCEVMKKMKSQAKYFRVLALSATPGNSINDVGEVINTLMISHLEYRTEDSPDVKPYVFERKMDTVVVPLGQKLEQVRNDYIEILEKYSRTLLKYKVVQGNCSALTKGAIFRIKKEYQEKGHRDPHHNEVILTLNICMSLFHASELLIRHGLRGFLSYFEEHISDPLLRNNNGLIRIMEDVRSYLGPMPSVEKLPDGSYPEVPLNITFGHPKFYKLRDILISHFNNSEDNSKVIVFFEYRDSVKEAFLILLQARPIIRPEMFVGQKSGVVTQKMQLRVINTFRDGDCNTLLSTSIGEEGLDVGEVDLIICFDISSKSPIRMIQRMGRTGRKREGQVVILVTEGREQQTLNDCLFHKNNMKSWAGNREIMSRFFVQSPRMVPKEIMPQCMKMQITVTKPTVTKNGSLKNFMRNMSSGSTSTLSEDVEIVEIEERIPNQISLFNKPFSHVMEFSYKPFLNKYIEHQRTFQQSSKISSSDASKLFVNLMKFADSKRFNLPLTQNTNHTKNLKQGDIRDMFNIGSKNSLIPSQDIISQSNSLPSTQKELSNQEIEDKKFRDKLHEEISIYISIAESTPNTCKFCERGFTCAKYRVKKKAKFLDNIKYWVPPSDLKFPIKLTAEDVQAYKKSISNFNSNIENPNKDTVLEKNEDVQDSVVEPDLFPDEKIDENVEEKSFSFDTPKSFGNLLDKYNISSTLPNQNLEKNTQESSSEKPDKQQKVMEHSFGSNQTNSDKPGKNENFDSVLSFFKLDKIEDIFDADNITGESDDSGKTIIDENVAQLLEFERESSPVLSTQTNRRKNISAKHKPIIVETPSSPILDSSGIWRSQKEITLKGRPSLDIIDTSIEETLPKKFSQKNKSKKIEKVLSSTNKVDFIQRKSTNSDEENLLGLFSTKRKTKAEQFPKLLCIEDIFDLWSFGLTIDDFRHKEIISSPVGSENKENIGHCSNNGKNEDLPDFSMLITAESTRIERDDEKQITAQNNLVVRENKLKSTHTKLFHEEENNSKKQDMDPSSLDEFCDLSIFGLTQHDQMGGKPQEVDQSYQNNTCEVNESDKNSKFDDFTDQMVTQHMTTQNRCSQMANIKESVGSSYGSLQLKRKETNMVNSENTKNQDRNRNVETNGNNDDTDIIILEDSPMKNSIIDLTQSPKGLNKLPPKRKILSQMSITQILSLAEKPTQSVLSSTNSLSKSVSKNKQTKLPSETMSLEKNKQKNMNRDEITELEDFEDFNHDMKSPPLRSKNICKSSLLDDLRNFDDFNDSVEFKKPSPIFKKPSTSKAGLDKIRKEQKKSFSPNRSIASSLNLSTTIESDEELHNHSGSSKLSSSVLNSNSDDEFETTIYPSTSKRKQTLQKSPNNLSLPKAKKKVRKKTRKFDLIEEEADVSIDGGSLSEDESEEDGSFDESFVDDDTQNFQIDTQMHVNYLKSVRSPSTGQKFKFPRTVRPITDDIFSQPAVRDEPNTYQVDSFCVNNEDIEESHDLSELDILEKKLEEKRKKRKKSGNENKKIKRRRIILMDSDSE